MPRILKKSTWFLHFSICLLLLVCIVTALTRITQMTKLERNAALDDNTCLKKDLMSSTNVMDVSICAFMCIENDTCQTIFYNHQDGKCSGCTARYSSTSMPLPSTGFIHFQKARTSCDVGWTTFQGSCYTLSPTGSFMDGVHYCETISSHPVYVETSEENEFLKTHLKTDTSNSGWYIGIIDTEATNVWKYYNTNTLVQFKDFHSTQPNGQKCAFFSTLLEHNYQWADHHCTYSIPTICEKAL